MWPSDPERLTALQRELAAATPEPWEPSADRLLVGGCWVCFPRGLTGPGDVGDPAWAAAVVLRDGRAGSRPKRTRRSMTGTTSPR